MAISRIISAYESASLPATPRSRLRLTAMTKEAALLDGHIPLWHGHQADPSSSGAGARIAKFIVGKFWTALQRVGFRDPTRAANNPGRCDQIDATLHAWATGALPDAFGFKDGKIDTIIAGHTHRPVYENLSLTERLYLESHIGTQKKL